MKIAIMQPYFLPYIGYWQLMNGVDTFVVYDQIQYTKKGWMNRNRYLSSGEAKTFSLSLQKDSDFLDVNQRFLAKDYDRKKLLNQWRGAYQKAPFFAEIFPLLESIVNDLSENLFDYIFQSIQKIHAYLGMKSKLVISSEIEGEVKFKGVERVQDICCRLGTTHYLNSIGGTELYSKEDFQNKGIELSFLQSDLVEYPQFRHDFVPWLSIVDVLMFNSLEQVRQMLGAYQEV